MRVILILIWINILLLLGHILYQLLCCCKFNEPMQIAKFIDPKMKEDDEELKLPPPTPPKIVIAPPKDIEIPSAGVDVDYGF